MMAKMGYREGQGLGRAQQGMSSALIVEKTSKRGGKIVHEKELTSKGKQKPFSDDRSQSQFQKHFYHLLHHR